MNINDRHIIVSRHPAAIAFIREKIAEIAAECNLGLDPAQIRVVAEATADDVRGKSVWGNVPLHLGAAANAVNAVEFEGQPPRGAEYTADDMRRAGAKIRRYRVEACWTL